MRLEAMRTELAKITTFGVNNGHPQIRLPFLQEIERHIDSLVDGLAPKEQIETMQDRIALAVLPGILDRCSRLHNEYSAELMVDHAFEIARAFMARRPKPL